MTGSIISVAAGLLPIDVLGQLVSIGTLLAFVLVCIGVVKLRRTAPDLERPFRTPWVPTVPILGAVICLAQMVGLPLQTWIRLVIWLAAGLAIYFGYSRSRASIIRVERRGERAA
jgi:APA family basic amino acid/polyamine antiporter